MKKNKLKTYGLFILFTEIVGGVAGIFTSMGMDNYKAVEKPPLTPPDIVFPVVWTILYALLGISAARIWMRPATKERNHGLIIWGIQLFFNFFWSLIFFNLGAFGFAFFWILLLLASIIAMIYIFYKTDKTASLLQLPYLFWVAFATYLNLMVWLLNR